ncbi:MAG: hypothetical protein MJZ34_15565 [Paludibacteraceae bacterium]|nr:hypothetical protein [Paludibacteraceae bacterium]
MKKRSFVILSLALFSLCSCGKDSSESVLSSSETIEEPITNKTLLDKKAKEFQNLADRCVYDFDPTSVEMTKRTNPDGSELTANDIRELTKSIKSIDETRTKEGKEIHVCYRFERVFAEGFNGDYTIHKAKAVLYEDGLSFFERNGVTSGGVWWKESDTIHVSTTRSGRIIETESREIDGELYLPIPNINSYNDSLTPINARGGYYYPVIGIFIEDIRLQKEVSADDVFYKTPIGDECPVYVIDKSLNYYPINSFDDELKFLHLPEWNYPHDDEYVAEYKGMTAIYSVKVLPSKRNYSLNSTELTDKTFPLYTFDYLKYIEASSTDDLAFNYRIKGNELHTYLNPKTDELTTFLPNGRLERTNISFNYSEEDNHFDTTYKGNEFGFTFKSQDSLEISLGDKKETLKIGLSHVFKSYLPYAFITDHDHNHEGCLVDQLPESLDLHNSRGVLAVVIKSSAN